MINNYILDSQINYHHPDALMMMLLDDKIGKQILKTSFRSSVDHVLMKNQNHSIIEVKLTSTLENHHVKYHIGYCIMAKDRVIVTIYYY